MWENKRALDSLREFPLKVVNTHVGEKGRWLAGLPTGISIPMWEKKVPGWLDSRREFPPLKVVNTHVGE